MSEALQQQKEVNRLATGFKKMMTRQMMQNTEVWKQFLVDNAELYKKVQYPQELISVLSAPYARRMMDTEG